ncbi:MAG: molybdopterin-dependent oxidoreductase, partial [Candidatus Heimdallarchaeota archaeon]
MKLTRREFLKTSAVVAGFAALSDFALGGPASTFVKNAVGSGVKSTYTEEWVPTTCWIGKQDCGILARKINGRLVKLEGHPDHPRNRGKLCPKGQAQLIAIYDPYRVKAPLKRTNAKGEPGEWIEISWEEALTEVATKINDVRSRDPRLLVWQKGRSKAKKFYDKAFVNASGATKLHHGAFCSDAAYRACEYTVGLHGGLHPDFKHCNYLLNWGWNITGAGGNKFCWLTWNQQFVDARERGMKVVTLDPSLRQAAHHTDEWLPIKPGTDLAFFLAVANVLIENNYVDETYLKNYTNAPFLVKGDGYFLKISDKEQVWDTTTNSAQPYDASGVDPALEGEYTVNGESAKPAFQLFKEHVSQYSPEQVASITGLSAEQIRGVAEELGENAKIGSKIVLDGVELPYRPVGIMGYHVVQQELGFQATRAALLVSILLGAIEAVGGVRVDFSRKVHSNFQKLDEITIGDPPYNIYLKNSKYFPINSNNSSIAAQVILDPQKYGVDYTPEVLIIHMANPLLSFPPVDLFYNAYKKFNYVVVIDPWLSETADYFADIVLPAATIEKYEGPLSATDQYEDATALRLPPIEPLYSTKGDIDIYIELCEKAGILYGP